jgi:formylglycine-generating enzyme required for sulfatase activity
LTQLRDRRSKREFVFGLVSGAALASVAVLSSRCADTGWTSDAGGDVDGRADQAQTDVALSGDAQDGAPVCATPTITADCARGWCRIPEGCFKMGSPETEWGRAKYKEQQTETTLTRPFALGSFEVTQAQWIESGGAILTKSGDCVADQCPAIRMTWSTALDWTNAYSKKQGLTPCYELGACTGASATGDLVCPDAKMKSADPYQCDGYRLPTEAEWEYAARAGTSTTFFSGDIKVYPEGVSFCNPDPALDEVAWYCVNSGNVAHPVGQKKANPWGLYDVLGNVSEWVTDPLVDYDPGPRTDPWKIFKPSDGLIADRSGSAKNSAAVLRSAERGGNPSVGVGSAGGLRLARTLKAGMNLSDLVDMTPK